MKAQQWPYCRICTRDLVDGACAHCESSVPDVRPLSRAERMFGVISRQPGLSVGELAELLGEESEQDMMNWSNTLRQLRNRGAIRHEGPRMDRVYYPVDASKIPHVADVRIKKRKRGKGSRKRKALFDHSKLRLFRASNNLCYDCGSSLAELEDWDKARCPECCERAAEKMRKYRQTKKGLEVSRLASRRHYEKNRALICEHDRVRYMQKKLRGECVSCASKVIDGSAYCSYHTEMRHMYARNFQARLYEKSLKKGLCVRCGKGKPPRGYKRCDKCRAYVTAWKQSAKRRAA